jgi:hypothetical protein
MNRRWVRYTLFGSVFVLTFVTTAVTIHWLYPPRDPFKEAAHAALKESVVELLKEEAEEQRGARENP